MAKGVMVGVVVFAAFATIFVVGGGNGAHAVAAGHAASDSAELPVTVGQLAQLPIIAGVRCRDVVLPAGTVIRQKIAVNSTPEGFQGVSPSASHSDRATG